MERPTATTKLRIGDWCANPASGEISRNGEIARVEVRTMRLLLCLAEHAGEVVSIDDLLNQVWPDVVVAPDSVYQAVTSLRRLLGDDPKRPTYIATVPRLGYRMVATVGPWTDQSMAQKGAGTKVEAGSSRAPNGELANSAILTKPTTSALDVPEKSGPRLRSGSTLAATTAVCLALVVALLFYGKLAKNNHSASSTNSSIAAITSQPQKSVAVLPFLDLTTQEMNEEYFADGMTEELIDRLSKIPGLRVPPPTSSFYFKGKRVEVNEIAKALGVAYLLDGSVRKSGATLRVAARLIRANDGYVVWSETYDRPLANELTIQDDIASEVTRALKASIH
jgi:TolB-like protein/DNA-binding winged helix-turn-helix (wHTH) protein